MRCQCCRKHSGTVHVRDVAEWRTQSHVVVCDECVRFLLPFLAPPGEQPIPIDIAIKRARKAHEKSAESKEPSQELVDYMKGEGIDIEPVVVVEPEEPQVPDCPVCGMPFAQFRKEGRLGCGECYDAFSEPMKMLLFRMHGDSESQHRGRRPGQPASDSRGGRRSEIQQLRRQMLAAVEAEAYERAAELRDQISKLEAALGENVPVKEKQK